MDGETNETRQQLPEAYLTRKECILIRQIRELDASQRDEIFAKVFEMEKKVVLDFYEITQQEDE